MLAALVEDNKIESVSYLVSSTLFLSLSPQSDKIAKLISVKEIKESRAKNE